MPSARASAALLLLVLVLVDVGSEVLEVREVCFLRFSSSSALVLSLARPSLSLHQTHSSQLSPPPTAFWAPLLVAAEARASLSKASTSAGVSSEGAMPLNFDNFDYFFSLFDFDANERETGEQLLLRGSGFDRIHRVLG